MKNDDDNDDDLDKLLERTIQWIEDSLLLYNEYLKKILFSFT